MQYFAFRALLEAWVALVVWGEVKVWRFDTNWDTSANWSGGRVPGCGDAAEVPGAAAVVVALPQSACVRTLVLGEAVELLLPRDGALTVDGDATSTQNPALKFLRGEREFLDPEAWSSDAPISSSEGEGSEVREAVPHVERVPCRRDIVRFPTGSFSARLSRLPLLVQNVQLGRRNLSPNEWRQLRDSTGGQAMLRRDMDVNGLEMGWTACSEVAGCSCHSSTAFYNAAAEAVCATSPRCGPTPCVAPVKPEGHCCRVCGAVLQLRVGRRFSMTRLQGVLRRVAPPASRLLTHASRLPEDRVQVVLLERGSFEGLSGEAALLLQSDLLADLSLGVSSVSTALPGAPLRESGVYIILLGTLLANCILFFFIFIVFSNWHLIRSSGSREENSFLFARFENVDVETDSIEVAVGSSAFSEDPEKEETEEVTLQEEGDESAKTK